MRADTVAYRPDMGWPGRIDERARLGIMSDDAAFDSKDNQ